MTSGVPFGPGVACLQPGRAGLERHALPIRYSALIEPSIRPSSTVILDAFTLCGPPSSKTLVSWYGRRQIPLARESGTHTLKPPPFLFGIPFAPGNVPK